MKDVLENMISEIEKFEIDKPLGIRPFNQLSVYNGWWNHEEKVFTPGGNSELKFTLEELQFYYKLVCFLTIMDLS